MATDAKVPDSTTITSPFDYGNTGFEPDEAAAVTPPAGTDAPAAEPVKPAEPAKPIHSKRVLKMAKDFGIAQNVIDKSTPDELDELVFETHQNLIANSRSNARDQVQREPERASPAPAASPAPVEPDELDELGELKDQLDPKFQAFLRKLAKKKGGLDDADAKAIKDKLEALTESEKRRSQTVFADLLDAGFSELGPRYLKLFGDEPGGELDPADAKMKRRIAIIRTADIKQDDTARRVKMKLKAAAEELYGEVLPSDAPTVGAQPADPYAAAAAESAKKPTPAKDPVTGRFTKEEWEEAGLGKPTHREVVDQPGVEKATRSVRKQLRETVGDTDATDKEVLNGFLG